MKIAQNTLFDIGPYAKLEPSLFPHPKPQRQRIKLPLDAFVYKWIIGSGQAKLIDERWTYCVHHHFITQYQGYSSKWWESRHSSEIYIMVELFSGKPYHYWNLAQHLKDRFYNNLFTMLATMKTHNDGVVINKAIRHFMDKFYITEEDIDPSSLYRMYNRRREEFEAMV
jgi:hypothetical protein